MASLEDATTRRSPSAADQHDARGRHVEHLDASVGEQRQQIDDVEVVDERVGQLDECPDEQRFVLHQRPPAVASRVGDRLSRNVRSDGMARRSECDAGSVVMRVSSRFCTSVCVRRRSAVCRATTSLATSSSRRSLLKANARIRISASTDAHAELDRDHARCLVHDRAEVRARPRARRPRLRAERRPAWRAPPARRRRPSRASRRADRG